MKFLKLRLWWNDMTTLEQVLYVIKHIIGLVACVFIILMVTGVWDYGFAVAVLCWMVVGLLNAYELWDEHRRLAIFDLCSIALVIVCLVAVILWED